LSHSISPSQFLTQEFTNSDMLHGYFNLYNNFECVSSEMSMEHPMGTQLQVYFCSDYESIHILMVAAVALGCDSLSSVSPLSDGY
jgi:hypothetical protein